VFSRDETKQSILKATYPDCRYILGDVRDLDWLRTVIPGHDTVIHTAAIKIVPLAEANARETILTNVMGSLNVAQASVESGVERVIGVLTDKLVHSVNTYGHSKALNGSIFREANCWGDTVFTMCRYGNVLGSNQSILEYLIKLKAENKPFKITDARCSRFWLTMADAVNLVLMAVELQYPGSTVVPKAPASYVIDLFKAVDEDHEIIDIGLRLGEKIHEQLLQEVESRHTVDMGDYFIVYPPDSMITSNLPDGYGYYSNNPARRLTKEDLRKMCNL
jgi:UDP-N-acetylglucosamine 4,6-dehydratase